VPLTGLDVFYGGPQEFAPRAAWVLDTLLAPLGRRARLTGERGAAGGCALAYDAAPVPDAPTIPLSAEALALFAADRPLPTGAFAAFGMPGSATLGATSSPEEPPDPSSHGAASPPSTPPAPNSASNLAPFRARLVGAFPAATPAGFAAPFDLLASAFALLACWDEHTSAERDRFGRLPFSASVFAANPALRIEEPAVDGYVAVLRAALAPRLAALGLPPLPAPGWMWRDGGSPGGGYALALTHDVDNLWRWTPRGFAATGYRSTRALRHRRWPALGKELGDLREWATVHLPRRSDPFWTFPQLLTGEDRRHVSSTFFVIARHTDRRDGNQPDAYRRLIPKALDMMSRGRREVGLHGNAEDRLGAEALRRDRADLARRAGGAQPLPAGSEAPAVVAGIRYHYLRCLYHETLGFVEQAGFAYDTSLAFAEHEGFRCGASFPLRPYDLAGERPRDLVELPLAIMDTSLLEPQYRHLPAAEAEEACGRVLDKLAAAGGAGAILWHNNRFDRRSARGYDDVYWRLVDKALADGAMVGSAGAVVDRWLERVGGAGTREAGTTQELPA
jgi:hypothetical protein